ncbi:MAG: ribosome recycling factor [Bacteroidota bacterium]
MDIQALEAKAKTAMQKGFEHLQATFARFRVNKVAADMIKDLLVDNYGVPTPLYQIADIRVVDATKLEIKPWNKKLLTAIGKTIQDHNAYDFNIVHQGDLIRLYRQPLTQESRLRMLKELAKKKEEGHVMIRNMRKQIKQEAKSLISEDEKKLLESHLQKHTDEFITKIDTLYSEKEIAIMKV